MSSSATITVTYHFPLYTWYYNRRLTSLSFFLSFFIIPMHSFSPSVYTYLILRCSFFVPSSLVFFFPLFPLSFLVWLHVIHYIFHRYSLFFHPFLRSSFSLFTVFCLFSPKRYLSCLVRWPKHHWQSVLQVAEDALRQLRPPTGASRSCRPSEPSYKLG